MRNTIFILFIGLCTTVLAQTDTLRIVSYNVENLFDCKHDSLKNDYEFLPHEDRHWTPDKYKTKLANIARVISTIGQWKAPVLVGLIEIENKKTLFDLTKHSPLSNLKYKFIHSESPDRRGIDVALLYQPQQFSPIKKAFYTIKFPDNPRSKTRDILYVAGQLTNGDTLHVFVNHFPSRLGGEKASENKRIYVASVLKSKVDSIVNTTSHPNIIIMGDFNDYPSNKSIKQTLGAQKPDSTPQTNSLYNLYYQFEENGNIGSHKYKGDWGMLDQIIVSGNMLLPNNTLFTNEKMSYICQASFLLEDDSKDLGKKPFRTYQGTKYMGGYSDHLPLYIDIVIKK
jgi:predicted extracellular nuclease